MLLAAFALALPLGPSTEPLAQSAHPLPPGRYCAYDQYDMVSPPGEGRTRVIVEQRDGAPYVSFVSTWPHNYRVLDGEGPAQVDADGVLRFQFDGGWGNDVVVGLLHPDGLFEMTPVGEARDDGAAHARIYMYAGAQVAAADCRPGDLD